MPIRFACPKCKSALEVPEDRIGTKSSCPHCGQRVQVPDPNLDETMMGVLPQGENWNEVARSLAAGSAPLPVPPLAESSPPSNPIQRYVAYCGKRSAIFQALLLGWTACVFLGTCGLLLSLSTDRKNSAGEREARAESALLGMCCSGGVYFMVAMPLGLGAIATLREGTRKP